MAQKMYTISQLVNLNGQKVSRSMSYFGELEDVNAFIALLEGKVVVKEAIIEQGSADTLVTSANFYKSLTMLPPSDVFVPAAFISTYDKKQFIVKNTVSFDDIKTALSTFTPFRGNAVAKPAYIKHAGGEATI